MPKVLSNIHRNKNSDRVAVYTMLIASLVLAGLLLRPFIAAITGAGLIALITHNQSAWLRRHIRNRTLMASIAVLFVCTCVVTPAWFAVGIIIRRFIAAIGLLRSPEVIIRMQTGLTSIRSALNQHSFLTNGFEPNTIVNNTISLLGSVTLNLLSTSLGAITQITIMLFLLFFWYRDEQKYRERMAKLLILSSGNRRFIIKRLRSCVRATVFSRMIVSAVQGLLAWLIFVSLSIPEAVLLANATTVCALIPAFGAFLVWLPVVGYLLLIHAWGKAILLALAGSVVLSTVDNVLFPILAGSQSHLGTPEMFLAVFGGIALFGISGLVIGPLIWVAMETLAAVWIRNNFLPFERLQ